MMEPTNLSPHDAVCHVPPRHVALDKRDRLSPLESSPAAAGPSISPVQPVSTIALRGPVTARAAPRKPSSTASSPCADNVGPAAASPKRSPYRPPPSAASSVAPDSTVSVISNPLPPLRRYEHPVPGELPHLDIKKLGRFQRAGHRVAGDKTRRSRASPRQTY